MFKRFATLVAIGLCGVLLAAAGKQFIGSVRIAEITGPYIASAIFEVNSTVRGAIECPKMTTTQKNAITSPASYLCVSDITLGDKEFWNGATWVPFVLVDGSTVSYNASNQLRVPAGGIGTSQLANLAVTAGKIASATITTSQIAAATILGSNIAPGTIGTDKLSFVTHPTVWGVVRSDGAILAGTGFSVSSFTGGVATVAFSPSLTGAAFGGFPFIGCVVSIYSGSSAALTANCSDAAGSGSTVTGMSFNTFNAGGVQTNESFSFIVSGN